MSEDYDKNPTPDQVRHYAWLVSEMTPVNLKSVTRTSKVWERAVWELENTLTMKNQVKFSDIIAWFILRTPGSLPVVLFRTKGGLLWEGMRLGSSVVHWTRVYGGRHQG